MNRGKDLVWDTLPGAHCTLHFCFLKINRSHFILVWVIPMNLPGVFWIAVFFFRVLRTFMFLTLATPVITFPHHGPVTSRFKRSQWSVTVNLAQVVLNSLKTLLEIKENWSNLSPNHCWLGAFWKHPRAFWKACWVFWRKQQGLLCWSLEGHCVNNKVHRQKNIKFMYFHII